MSGAVSRILFLEASILGICYQIPQAVYPGYRAGHPNPA